MVDPAIKDQLGGPHLQPLGRELAEQGDGVVVQLTPTDGVKVPKEVDDLRLPTPPQVAGQGHALVVEGFGGEMADDWGVHPCHRSRINLTHGDFSRSRFLVSSPKVNTTAAL